MTTRLLTTCTLAAALALYFLVADPEPGAQIYSAAWSRDQAKIVLDQAKRFVRASPELSERCVIYQNAIAYRAANGDERFYKALSTDSSTAHGLNPSALLIDEAHAWEGERGKSFFEVLFDADQVE